MSNMPTDRRGTTRDPEQADKAKLPEDPKTKVDLDVPEPKEDEPTGPGTIHDPNMADRT
ncbi:hypothetical protein [Salipiger sp. IMCC34102]|uniref:hypothetical protein n=1 Tax=Salipiger sp. IMCC34102 TaxID=2510647 RepID=UPI0013E9C8D3|nr:hypothetical protein [Salipiger sp. IMCC34102]